LLSWLIAAICACPLSLVPHITATCSALIALSLSTLLTLVRITALVALLTTAIIRFLIWHNKRFKNY